MDISKKITESEKNKLLKSEVSLWHKKKIINSETKSAIYSYISSGEIEDSGRYDKFILILGIIGVLFLGMGVLLIISSFWGDLNSFFRIALVFTAMVLSYLSGYYLTYHKQSYPKIGRSLLFLGVLLFGANLFVVVQTTNYFANSPILIGAWLLMSLMLSLMIKHRELNLLTYFLTMAWMGAWSESYEILNFVFPLLYVFGLYKVLKSKFNLELILISILMWGVWIMDSYDMYATYMGETLGDFGGIIVITYIFFLYVLANLFLMSKNSVYLVSTLKKVSLFFTLLFFFFLGTSVEAFNDITILSTKGLMPIFLLLPVLSSIICGHLYLKDSSDYVMRFENFLFLAANIVVLLLSFLVFSENIVSNLLFSLISFIFIFAGIYIGFLRKEKIIVNFSLIMFLINLMTQYYHYLVDLLPKSIFFLLGGVLFLSVGFYVERTRKNLIT